jgi:hypothetical protein
MTVLSQNKYASTRTYKGFNPAYDYIPILRNEGQSVLTTQKLSSLAKQIEDKRFYRAGMMANKNSPINTLEKAISQWKVSGKKVVLFINPYQDIYYDTLAKEGLSKDLDEWRSTIEKVATNTNSYFYDFTELGISHSNLLNSKNELEYFWEPAHYKKELGEKMLKVMTTSQN